MNVVLALIAGVIGVLMGGVMNMLADDLPHRLRVQAPHYPDGTPRPRPAWLGIGAFLTGQRVSPAPAPLPEPLPEAGVESAPAAAPPVPRPPARLGWRHPLVEIVTGLAFMGLVLGYPHERNLWAWFVYVFVLLLITVIDMEHRLILFVVIIPSCLFALLVAAVSPPGHKPFSEFLLGGGVGFGVFFLMFLGGVVFTAASRRDEVAFGFGDVMLATLSGLILGWRAFIFASLITVFAGAFGAVLYIGGRTMLRRRYRWFTPLPYGPYIVFGTLVMLLLREQIAHWLQTSMY